MLPVHIQISHERISDIVWFADTELKVHYEQNVEDNFKEILAAFQKNLVNIP